MNVYYVLTVVVVVMTLAWLYDRWKH